MGAWLSVMAGSGADGAVTVQFPISRTPVESPALSEAHRYTPLVPAKAAVKLRLTVMVNWVPEMETELPVPYRVHWLFCRVPLDPGVSGPSQEVRLSLAK